jgi:hypothetical protein
VRKVGNVTCSPCQRRPFPPPRPLRPRYADADERRRRARLPSTRRQPRGHAGQHGR